MVMDVAFNALNKAGTELIEQRREDGHGSSFQTPTFIADSKSIEWVSVPVTVTNAGPTTIYTPASGKRVRLHWIYAVNDPVSETSTKITVKIGANTYYCAWAISKTQQFTGPVNGQLIIDLSAPGNVAVTAFIEEVD